MCVYPLQNTMDHTPEEQESLYKALFVCHCHISEENHFIVPFICASAVPHGVLYKKNLESIPTVPETFTALFNYSSTNEISLALIKFALKIAGCPPEKIEQVQNDDVQETNLQRDDTRTPEITQGLEFHKLLVDIINALPADLRCQMISMSSGFLSRNPTHTNSLYVHFLHFIQAKIIGINNVTKLHKMIESVGRQDLLDAIDTYCEEFGLPVLPRQGKKLFFYRYILLQ